MTEGAGAPNAEQREHWDGEGGRRWVAEQARHDTMLRGFGDRAVEALDLQPGERALDVGCGNGAMTVAMGERVAPGGSVVGIDLSGPMLAVARERARAAGLAHVELVQGDAQVHRFADPFDAVASRFGVMFFADPAAAFANLCAATRPGGRLAFVCWQEMLVNEWIVVPAAAALEHVPTPALGGPGPGPYALADAAQTRALLTSAGWDGVAVEAVEERMVLGQGSGEVVDFLRGSSWAKTMFAGVDPDTAARAWAAVGEALEACRTDDGVVLGGKAWLVTGRRAGR